MSSAEEFYIAYAEREKLRAENERLRAQLWTDDEVEHEMALARAAIIEECARVAEEGWRCTSDKPLTLYERIAAAIRALKEDRDG